MPCKLTLHQIRAMVEKIQATIDSHDRRPGNARNLRELEKAYRRLEAYKIELAKAEEIERQAVAAAAADQTADEIVPQQQHAAHLDTADQARPVLDVTAHLEADQAVRARRARRAAAQAGAPITPEPAAVCGSCEGTGTITAAGGSVTARGCAACSGTGMLQPGAADAARPITSTPHGVVSLPKLPDYDTRAAIADRATPEDPDQDPCNGEDIEPAAPTPRVVALPRPATRPGHSRTPYKVDQDPAPDPWQRKAQATEELITYLLPLTERYTPGALTAAVFKADQQRYLARQQARQA